MQEAWNSHFVYGNIYDNSSTAPIHFSEDHDGGEPSRKGSLFWYNNTLRERLCASCSGQKWTLFDTSMGGGNFSSHVEWQTVQTYNNIIWMDDPTKPVEQLQCIHRYRRQEPSDGELGNERHYGRLGNGME
jgi:hypothetical protein